MAIFRDVILIIVVLFISSASFFYYAGRLYYVGPEVEMCAELAAMQENTETLFYSGYINEYFSWTPPKEKEVQGQVVFSDKRVMGFNCKYREGDIDIKAVTSMKGVLSDKVQ